MTFFLRVKFIENCIRPQSVNQRLQNKSVFSFLRGEIKVLYIGGTPKQKTIKDTNTHNT